MKLEGGITQMKHFIIIFVVLIAQNLLADVPTDPTIGWKQVPFKFDVQKPWDLDVSKRYRFDPTNGIYDLWVYKTDKPHAPNNKTDPRTELSFSPTYKTGEHMFDADVYVVAGTRACIMQIWGAATNATTIMFYAKTNGTITYYRGDSPVIKTNANNVWWNLKVAHNTEGQGEIKVYVDNVLVNTFSGRGKRKDGGDFYFKCGVYGTTGYSEARFRNIKIWEKPASAQIETN
jgi:hypothetical protein